MSSGEDRTHHWLLTSPGPGEGIEEEAMVEGDPAPGGHCMTCPFDDQLTLNTVADGNGE